jgi:hypothetical protein
MATIKELLSAMIDKINGNEDNVILAEDKITNAENRLTGVENKLVEHEEKIIEAANSSVQSDLGVNDETNPSYVKNRTHYEVITVEDIIPQCTLTGSDGQFQVTPDSVENIIMTNFILGEEYTVTWNGTVYKTLAKEFSGMVVLGTLGNFGGTHTGEPFIIACSDVEYMIISFDSAVTTTLNLKVNGKIADIHKINEKYLPNSNILNGSNIGSVRTIHSRPEDDNYTIGIGAFAEGIQTTSSGYASHAEGMQTTASGQASHAEGQNTTASGEYSHAEGIQTISSGHSSHAEGQNTTASGDSSHAEGFNTTASSQYQHVQGKYNIDDANNTYAHIVGNGESGALSNAHTLDWEGNAWFAGTVEGTAMTLRNGEETASLTMNENKELLFNGEAVGGSGGVTSWNDLEDRPFYAKEPIENTLFERQLFSFVDADMGGLGVCASPVAIDLVEGRTYKVTFDDVPFDVVCVNFNSMLVLGNLGVLGAGEDSGEPFFYYGGNWVSKDIAEHNISMSEVVVEYVQIPVEYIPVVDGEKVGGIKVYKFPMTVPIELMEKAVSEFNDGKAMIIWHGSHILYAELASDNKMRVIRAINPTKLYAYEKVEGSYNESLRIGEQLN